MTRDFLYQTEIDALLEAAKSSSKPARNLALILVMYRHGLRASEALDMQWQDINFTAQEIFVRRCKGSVSGSAPLWRDELKALLTYQKKSCDRDSGFVWLGQGLKPLGYDGLYYLIRNLGAKANLSFPLHPHQLRHSCGYHLINKGHDLRLVQQLLGHKSITNTVRYTQLAAGALRKLVD
ncbi:MAG: tyrosine-type recombinase/integrase [Microcoleaceae cyanobacterium]